MLLNIYLVVKSNIFKLHLCPESEDICLKGLKNASLQCSTRKYWTLVDFSRSSTKIYDDRVEGQSNQHVEHSVIACNWPNESRSVCSHPEPKWGVLVHCRNIQFDLHWQFDWLLPLQQRAVRLPGWARAAPPSGYHSVLLHAVELVHSEHTYTTIVRRWFIVHVVESSWSRGDVESIVKATPTMTAEAVLMCATSM